MLIKIIKRIKSIFGQSVKYLLCGTDTGFVVVVVIFEDEEKFYYLDGVGMLQSLGMKDNVYWFRGDLHRVDTIVQNFCTPLYPEK